MTGVSVELNMVMEEARPFLFFSFFFFSKVSKGFLSGSVLWHARGHTLNVYYAEKCGHAEVEICAKKLIMCPLV